MMLRVTLCSYSSCKHLTIQSFVLGWSEMANKNLNPAIQNEMLELMSASVLRLITKDLQSAEMFAIMAVECVDISNREQLSICFQWVDSDLDVHEEFIGLYQIADIAANTIVQVLKDCLLRLNLQWN